MQRNAWGRAAAVILCSVIGLAAADAGAAGYPERPVRILVGFNPGGGTDQLARILAPRLSERWGQPVTVENRPGADGDIALEILMAAAPDGYTLAMPTNAMTIAPTRRKVSYDPLRSFAPITLLASVPGVLVVRQALPVSSLKELVALARSKPGQLNFGSTGESTTPYLQMALLMKLSGIDVVSVPYKGTPLAALLGGEIDMFFASVPSVLGQIRGGRIKALAVATKERAAQLPDVPTVAEAADLPAYEAMSWYGMLAPAATPRDVVARLNADFTSVMKEPAIRQRVDNLGFIAILGTPDDFVATMRSDLARWTDLRGALGSKGK